MSVKDATSVTLPLYGDLISRFPATRDYLIPILQELQEREGYLPEQGIYEVSDYLDLPESKVYGVATFYNQFKLIKPGKYRIQICRGTACHVKGSFNLLETLQRELGILPGETSSDGLFSLETVACLGACSIAPVIMVNGEFFGRLDNKKVLSLVQDFRNREEVK
ncbi:MAG: NAD(P)H-dependent oxidoreductase subunit E [Spirochaetales bacterium]|nr:NAD(P)H-dependent oxidoreductase subunit E [Spirochaetales bacterium]